MARKLRLEYAGACYHVINRGNYRRPLFAGKGAAAAMTQCLDEACVRFRWLVHAYVVMTNHFHLALTTPEPNLSEGMKWLQGTWAARFNRFRGEVGRPFQGRYKAFHVEPGPALAEVAHYIHLNPSTAGIVAGDRLAEYRWSSLHRFASSLRPPWLVGSLILDESGGLADTAGGWRSYLDYLVLRSTEAPRERKRKFGALCRGWAVGSPEFQEELRTRLAEQVAGPGPFSLLGADAFALQQARAQLWEKRLNGLAEAAGINLQWLPAAKSAPEKVLLAAVLKKVSSVSNRWLGERLAMGGASSVSSLVTRFERAGGAESEQFRTLYSRFAT